MDTVTTTASSTDQSSAPVLSDSSSLVLLQKPITSVTYLLVPHLLSFVLENLARNRTVWDLLSVPAIILVYLSKTLLLRRGV